MSSNKKNLLSLLVLESDNYSNIQDIEKLIDSPELIKAMPMQPLYLALKKTSYEQIGAIIPYLSTEQRQVLMDLDLFSKDVLDIPSFGTWLKAYSMCKDQEILGEFARSDEFLLYLKSVCNLYTFDVEDPQYPDHDNFFLTEDDLILVEYSEEYPIENELQYMIKNLYSDLGPEKAYKLLFKIVSESHMCLTEEVYQLKNDRLADFGFVDYYDALELRTCFLDFNSINNFIRSKKSQTANLDDVQKNQMLHSSVISAFKTGMDDLQLELSKIENPKRIDFLQFNFIRLINSTIALDNSLKDGPLALLRVGKVTRQILELGFDYVSKMIGVNKLVNVFELFDFKDLFKIGYSLIQIEQKRIKKTFLQTGFDGKNDYFLGAYWNHYVDASFEEVIKVCDFEKSEGKIINNYELFSSWSLYNKLLCDLLPTMSQIYKQIQEKISQGIIANQFYLNYQVDAIDFESIILTSFINFTQGKSQDILKLGLNIEEFTNFIDEYFEFNESEHTIKLLSAFSAKIKEFTSIYQLDNIEHIEVYIYQLIRDNLEGYNFNNIEIEDYKHIGGPIFLNK